MDVGARVIEISHRVTRHQAAISRKCSIANPSDFPVQQLTKFPPIIHLGAARALTAHQPPTKGRRDIKRRAFSRTRYRQEL